MLAPEYEVDVTTRKQILPEYIMYPYDLDPTFTKFVHVTRTTS